MLLRSGKTERATPPGRRGKAEQMKVRIYFDPEKVGVKPKERLGTNTIHGSEDPNRAFLAFPYMPQELPDWLQAEDVAQCTIDAHGKGVAPKEGKYVDGNSSAYATVEIERLCWYVHVECAEAQSDKPWNPFEEASRMFDQIRQHALDPVVSWEPPEPK
ncbi:MAG: hypothetical protein WD926_00550 [Patescibacteria group bacterium]